MPRYKLTIEYFGKNYIGWQEQNLSFPSIEGCLNRAIRLFCHHDVKVYGSGRTDAGVHARGQVAHVDLKKDWPLYTVREAINFYLRPHSIVVLSVEKVSKEFHARFDAILRYYTYHLICRPVELTFDQGKLWHIPFSLNIEKMKKATSFLLGYHDFTSFRSSDCQSHSPFKTLDKFDLYHFGNRITALIVGKSFLHHQVRNMMGTLVSIGKGRINPEDINDILSLKLRGFGGPTAPAHGLYLNKVQYD